MTQRNYPKFTLSSGISMFCLSKGETDILYREIPAYFRHGIKVLPGDVVFDVGANVGVFSLSVYEQTGGDVDLYAFEPIPAVYEVLRLNAERRDPNRFKAFPFGLSAEHKTMTFTYFPDATAWSSAYRNESNEATETIRNKAAFLTAVRNTDHFPVLRRMPQFMSSFLVGLGIKKAFRGGRPISCEVRSFSEIIHEHALQRVDLMKVDVEKSEMDVFKGINDQDWVKIQQIVVEVEDFDRESDAITSLLSSHGFSRISVEQDEVQRAGDYGMIYATRR